MDLFVLDKDFLAMLQNSLNFRTYMLVKMD